MLDLVTFFASFLDPISFITCIAVILLFTYERGKLLSVIAGGVVAIIVYESMMSGSSGLRYFGQSFYLTWPAKFLIAYISFELIRYFKRRYS